MIDVFIIDDHPIVIKGIMDALKGQNDIVITGHALTAREALEKLNEKLPHVVLLDVNLPDIDGIDLCKELTKQFPSIRIIGLTTFIQVSFISQMLQNGALGYLFKNTSDDEMIEAIRTVSAGEQYLSKEVNDRLISKATRVRIGRQSFIPKLTRREKEVLDLILAELTNQQIAEKLFISLSTVETHRMNLLAKMGAKNTAGMVKNAIKFGLA